MTDQNEYLARLAAQREAEGRAAAGDETHWKAALAAIERKMQAGDLSQVELTQKLTKQTAGQDLFYSGISEADEASWRAWRDSQPNRKARIERCK